MATLQPLSPAELYRRTDPEQFNFETTADLVELTDAIGQPRAIEAVRFGIGIDQMGYNIFAMGPSGVGKRELLQKSFAERAAAQPPPPDWCYVYNFAHPHRPTAIRLPGGKGAEFRQDMDSFVDELRTTLAAAFESDEYRGRRQVIEQEFQERQEKLFESVQQRARERGFAMLRTPGGLVFAPLKEGEVISPEELQNLPEEERKTLESSLEELQTELREALQQAPQLQHEIRERLKELNREFIEFAAGGLVDELQKKYQDFPEVLAYFDALQEDVVTNATDFLGDEEGGHGPGGQGPGGQDNLMAALVSRVRAEQEASLQRYKVNLLVDNRGLEGAPVVFEDNPTYQNLIGRVEHKAQMGALMTDFSLIRPGALHRANGGYLILDARKVLLQPYAWEALKRSLQSGQLTVESIGQMLSMISTVSLEPEPIPLNVKVALYGDRELYYALLQLDPDFEELFKVQADFEEQMDRDGDAQQQYARLIAGLVRENNLRPFARGAVARVIEHSARITGDAERMTTEVRTIANLLREASYWSQQNGNSVVTAADVEKALAAQVYRSDRLRERVQDGILRDIFWIETQGEKVGQVNGLSVIQMGAFAFGRPSRITARVRTGKGDVINIEREVEMSGPIHSKGVLILSGFLGARYAHESPLTLSASLVFEQSYSGVEGDSASSAELYALLSALAETPLKQSLAVTGAIDQHGRVQAIGGVNEKIEGFFDICQARGLTGEQGVLIPVSNVRHLMLRQDVIAAVAAGRFQIYPVENVDQGIELLTGIPAGEPNAEGQYPPDTINGRVQRRLEALRERQRRLNAEAREAVE